MAKNLQQNTRKNKRGSAISAKPTIKYIKSL